MNRLPDYDGDDVLLLLDRKKKGVLRILFSRTTFIILLLLLQFFLMFSSFYTLSEHILLIISGDVLISLCMAVRIVNKPTNADSKMTWLILLAVFPVFTALLYIFFEADIGFRMTEGRLSDILGRTYRFLPDNSALRAKLREEDESLANLSRYMTEYGGASVYKNSSVRYFPSGEAMFDALLDALSKAEKFIFLEYFIISEGYMWGKVLKILKEKADAGVEVMVLFDGTCAIKHLPYNYPLRLEKLGIRCRMFYPLLPLISSHYNNRDHRKIVVIDGQTAFTGGANIGDEYVNLESPYGHWKDASVQITGEAVYGFTLMFLQMWNLQDNKVDYTRYLSEQIAIPEDAAGYVIPYGDSPLDNELVGEIVYTDMLYTAKKYVHITTPYLIPDDKMLSALSYAAKRGVDVKIIVPGIPDKKLINMLTKSYYRELIETGVKIYEYTPGFIHSKTFVSDDKKAVVGTINLDYRSLYLHFECAAYLYDSPAVTDAETDFEVTLAKCRRVTVDTLSEERLFSILMGKILRLIAPLT